MTLKTTKRSTSTTKKPAKPAKPVTPKKPAKPAKPASVKKPVPKQRPASAPQKPTIMVSSAVRGQEELLKQIYASLTNLGYEVWMSYMGTLPTNAKESSLDNCLRAVENCDFFLGIITPIYGTTKGKDGKISATHEEIRKAIELDKPRWFIVDEHVKFVREILKKIYIFKKIKTKKTRKFRLERSKIILDTKLFNIKSIDLYEEVLQYSRTPSGQTEVKWVQPYSKNEEALLYVTSQFKEILKTGK